MIMRFRKSSWKSDFSHDLSKSGLADDGMSLRIKFQRLDQFCQSEVFVLFIPQNYSELYV